MTFAKPVGSNDIWSFPEFALGDGEKFIKPSCFRELMVNLKNIAEAVGKEL